MPSWPQIPDRLLTFTLTDWPQPALRRDGWTTLPEGKAAELAAREAWRRAREAWAHEHDIWWGRFEDLVEEQRRRSAGPKADA
jgi:hypothetical protein